MCGSIWKFTASGRRLSDGVGRVIRARFVLVAERLHADDVHSRQIRICSIAGGIDHGELPGAPIGCRL